MSILCLSNISLFSVGAEKSSEICSNVESFCISTPSISVIDGFVSVDVVESSSSLIDYGKPVLPVVTRVFNFPIGTKIKNVDVIFSDEKELSLSKRVEPSPRPLPLISVLQEEIIVLNEDVYSSSDLYPVNSFDYDASVGLDDGEHVVFLVVRCYPVRYSPASDLLFYSESFDISVDYEEPICPGMFQKRDRDLLIIAPRVFTGRLIPLIVHKNLHGVSTVFRSTEWIYRNYDGRDEQEDIKYFIRDAVEDMGVKYVLLVGGMKGQRFRWYLPVRYSNLDDWSDFDYSYISDLYYADIYKYNDSTSSVEFDTWDSNNNDVFAEWDRTSFDMEDVLDLYPDVYIGRLACRSIHEVKTTVRKIIKYENSKLNRYWFEKMIVAGGDTFPMNNSDYFEGEMESGKSASYIEDIGFDIVKLYVSDNSLTSQNDLIRVLNRGAGFMHLAGHGNPSTWATHNPYNHSWIDALTVFGMDRLHNRYKLPICVVGGCHNSQFNVTNLNILKGLIYEGSDYFSPVGTFWRCEWVSECWSWKFISRPKTGSIAVIGNTGLGYGYPGEYALDGVSGWLEPRFFQAYAVQGKDVLGQTHTQALNDFMNFFDVHRDRIDCKTVQQWVLLGDPTLKIGGY